MEKIDSGSGTVSTKVTIFFVNIVEINVWMMKGNWIQSLQEFYYN